jgi:hypothetical protein
MSPDERMITLKTDDMTPLSWWWARRSGGIRGVVADPNDKVRHMALWVENWNTPDDSLTWSVESPAEGDYTVSIIYTCSPACAGSEFEIQAGNVIRGAFQTTGNQWLRDAFKRESLEQKLHLPKGKQTLLFHFTRVHTPPSPPSMIKVFSIELTPVDLPAAYYERQARMKALRSPTDWFVEGKYGLMVHWAQRSYPLRGPRLPFQEAVNAFDVDRFARIVAETGAHHVTLTSCHGAMYFIGPIQAIERVLPGRTAKRDLVADLSEALGRYGIRLLLYYHYGTCDAEWAAASGFNEDAMDPYWDLQEEILREISQRYGDKIHGFFIDDGYVFYEWDAPFEKLTRAMKCGNSSNIVGYNAWIFPKMTDFQDYWCGESAGCLLPPPEPATFTTGEQAGLTGHLNPFLDDDWAHYNMDTDITPPRFPADEVIGYIKLCIENRVVPSMNLGITQDLVVNQATLHLLRTVRKEIFGK